MQTPRPISSWSFVANVIAPLGFGLIVQGCAPEAPNPAVPPAAAPSVRAVATETADSERATSVAGGEDSTTEIALQVGNWDDVQRLVQSHRGKIVVLDIWTTTCPTCLTEFPAFVEVHKKYGPERVACISVNCDYDGIATKPPEFYRERVVEFLTKMQAPFEHVMLNVPLIDFLDQLELASTPAVFIYGPDGDLVQTFDNDNAASEADEFHMSDVTALIDRLLAERR